MDITMHINTFNISTRSRIENIETWRFEVHFGALVFTVSNIQGIVFGSRDYWHVREKITYVPWLDSPFNQWPPKSLTFTVEVCKQHMVQLDHVVYHNSVVDDQIGNLHVLKDPILTSDIISWAQQMHPHSAEFGVVTRRPLRVEWQITTSIY